MCEKDEFKIRTDAFDRELLEFFEQWRSFVRLHLDELTLEHTNWLEEFCSYVWDSLVWFDKIGRLREPLKPRDESTVVHYKVGEPPKEKVRPELSK
jgi:hypothetical protein